MVTGIDKFREYFAAHDGHYAIVGGAACDLVFNAAGLDFRATRDIDMVICVEVDRREIRKHRNDVFRLAQLLPQHARVALPRRVHRDLRAFVNQAGRRHLGSQVV